jgi:CheY-like chemotaxis protein
MKQTLLPPDDNAILALTKDGERALREPGTTLSAAQLEALVLIDGHTTVEQVVKRARTLPIDVLRTSLSELIFKGFLKVGADPLYGDAIDPGDFFTLKTPDASAPEVGEHIHAEVDTEAEFLRRNGYYVSMARSPSVKQNRTAGRKLTVLVIEDDPDICKVLRMCLKLEDFDTRTAGNREEVVAAFRAAPLPDLVLLDVRLPDVNGFDVLAKMRLHPLLKGLPVIMLTAEATREAVLKGILGGANGFITKPFQIRPLVKAVKTVLGLQHDPND